jgi:cytochrome c-type biogenesis protein CcmE
MLNTRLKFITGGTLIFGAARYLMVTSISETAMSWLTPTELHAKMSADSSLRGVKVKVTGWVLPGSITRAEGGREVSFIATDGTKEFKVFYNKTPPDTFTDSASVVVTGMMQSDGTFAATELLAKCASRFEAVPDSLKHLYPESQGYKAGTKDGS